MSGAASPGGGDAFVRGHVVECLERRGLGGRRVWRANEMHKNGDGCHMRRHRLARSHIGDNRFGAGRHFVLGAGPNERLDAMPPRDEFWNQASSDVASSTGHQDGGTRHRGLGVEVNRRLIWNEGGVNRLL
jgi:hypothetical protein